MVLDVAATTITLASFGIALHLIGFEPLIPDQKTRPVYRFERGLEQIDVMVADHLPKSITTRYRARPAFEAPAGARRSLGRTPSRFGAAVFHAADRRDLAAALPNTHQVQLFTKPVNSTERSHGRDPFGKRWF